MDNITVYDNDIDMWLDEFKAYQQIDDLRSIGQNPWTAALMYIRKHLFPTPDILKSKVNIDNGSCTITNSGAYDYDLLNGICDHYIYLCSMYDKEVSIYGFCCLTGVDINTVMQWGNGTTGKLSSMAKEINKKLLNAREESLSGKLATGKQNPVGVLSILNHFYGWSQPGVTREVVKPALTADQLPKLGQITQHIVHNDSLPQDIDDKT